mgnify:CR=1 FL=1
MGVKIYKEGHTYPIYWAKKVGLGVWSSLSVYVEGYARFTCPEGVFVSTPNGSENTIYPRDYESIKDGVIVPGNLNLDGTATVVDTRVSVSDDTVTFFLRNDHEGEWIYTISVYGDGEESELKIGVEVEGEKENLGITMENLGVNYSLDTILSVWRGDPREDLPDWALINEKRREVLETIDLYAQKGSYRHLNGIFDWLEFPGETYELTRHWTEDGYRYSREGVGYGKTDLRHKTRTTLIASEIDQDTTWAHDDLRLKMWQIGNSLEKDLLPIHLDVHHSCVISEAKGKVELLYDHSNSTHTELSSEEDFDLEWGTDDSNWKGNDILDPDNLPSILIREVNGVTGPWGTIQERWPETFEEMPNLFHSLGATIRGTMKFPEKVIRGSRDGEIREFSSNELTFTFLYERPGEYHHTFQFTGESGKTYTRVVKIEVVDTVNVSIEFLGIDRKDRNPFLVPTDYAISIERVLEEKPKFKMYASLPLDEVHYYQLPDTEFEEYKRDQEAYASRLERLNPDWWIDFPTVQAAGADYGGVIKFVAKKPDPKPIQCPRVHTWRREVFLPGFYDTRPARDKEDVLILRPKIEGGLHWSLPDCRWKIQSLQDLTVHNFHGMRSLVLGYNSASPLKKGRYLVELSYNWGNQRTTKAISPYLLG